MTTGYARRWFISKSFSIGFLWVLRTGLAIVVLLGCSNPNERANKLFVEAHQLVDEGTETKDRSERLRLYRKALSNLEKIISDYPSSTLAKELMQGSAKVGNLTMKQFVGAIAEYEKFVEILKEPKDTIEKAILNSNPSIPSNWVGWVGLDLHNLPTGGYGYIIGKEKITSVDIQNISEEADDRGEFHHWAVYATVSGHAQASDIGWSWSPTVRFQGSMWFNVYPRSFEDKNLSSAHVDSGRYDRKTRTYPPPNTALTK